MMRPTTRCRNFRIYFWCASIALGAILQLSLLYLYAVEGTYDVLMDALHILNTKFSGRDRQLSESTTLILLQQHDQQGTRRKNSLLKEQVVVDQDLADGQQSESPSEGTPTTSFARPIPDTTAATLHLTNDVHSENLRLEVGNRTLLQPILDAGKLYSVGRKDRSGSVVTDMLYAHAFAFAINVTYGGACYTQRGFPRREVQSVLTSLGWDQFLPFRCPESAGRNSSSFKPDSTLLLDESLYRSSRHVHFTRSWRHHIRNQLPTRPKNQSTLEIVVHVRRGDVTPCRYKRRYLPNEHYLRLIEQYKPANRSSHVTIYSEPNSFEPFDAFRRLGYDVMLENNGLANIWNAIATADVAILSRSFFSFVPATINTNKVVYTPFFDFEPLEEWEVVENTVMRTTERTLKRMFVEDCNLTGVSKEQLDKTQAGSLGPSREFSLR